MIIIRLKYVQNDEIITYFEQQEKKKPTDCYSWMLLINAWMIDKKIILKALGNQSRASVRVFIDPTGQKSNLKDVVVAPLWEGK